MLGSFFGGAIGAGFALSAAIAPTLAHITLERREASIGSVYKAVLRVLHGFAGSPTTAIRVRVPAGLLAVKPMPKPGWQLATTTVKYPKPFLLRGAPVREGIGEIAWSGGRLLDAHYDEFVFIATIAEELGAGRTVHVPVVQECEKGLHRWIDVKDGHAPDTHGDGSVEPAPALRLLPRR